MARPRRRPPPRRPPASGPAGPGSLPRHAAIPLLALVVLAATLLRLLAARGDLWLDEIWSLTMLAELRSPLEILTRLQHDNNHVLNSLFLWMLWPFQADWLYRLPSVLAGGATVALGAWIAALGDDDVAADAPGDAAPAVRALLAALLLSGSYLLVQYASEARGYALAVGLAFLALAAARRGALAPASPWAPVYGLSLALALLAHPLAVHALTGGLAWSVWRWWRQRLGLARLARAAVWWHALPILTGAAFYWGFVRHMAVGKAPSLPFLDVIGHGVADTTGLPLALGARALVVLGLGVFAAGLGLLARRGADVWVFYLTAILLSPVAVEVVRPSDLHFERFFVLNAALGLLLLARVLGFVWARGVAGAVAGGLIVALSLSGSAPRVARLLEEQRGHYRAALAFMARASDGDVVRLSSDHDFRTGMIVGYYAPRVPGGKRFEYVRNGSWAGRGPDWLVVHRSDDEPAPASALADSRGNDYRFQAGYASAPLSGFRWYVYRRVGG